MSRYALSASGDLIVSWPTASADPAVILAPPPGLPVDALARLAATLTILSEQLWRTYTHPASAVPEDGPNSEHARRQRHHTKIDTVPEILRAPHVPDENGNILSSYDRVEETAHHVGRALPALDNLSLAELVHHDVAQEVAAVRKAELGDLTGRAVQAVALTRPEASPAQIAEAHRALADDPLGSTELFERFEPTAAAVAAAHWLHTAAQLTADECGYDDLTTVSRDADDIEALPIQTPMVVVGRMAHGESAQSIVIELISEAQTAAEGLVPSPERLIAQLDQALAQASQYAHTPEDEQDFRNEFFNEVRVCLLDPARPAQDLLEDLLAGIRACWLIYTDSSELGSDEADDDFVTELRRNAVDTIPD